MSSVEKILQVLELHAEGLPVTTACEEIGLARRTLYDGLNANPELATAMDNARTIYVEGLFGYMRHVAKTENDPARARNIINVAMFTIEKYAPSKYGPKMQVEVEHKLSLKDAMDQGNKRLACANSAPPIDHNAQDAEILELVANETTDTQSEELPDWMD